MGEYMAGGEAMVNAVLRHGGDTIFGLPEITNPHFPTSWVPLLAFPLGSPSPQFADR